MVPTDETGDLMGQVTRSGHRATPLIVPLVYTQYIVPFTKKAVADRLGASLFSEKKKEQTVLDKPARK
jgi:hypothetical protein